MRKKLLATASVALFAVRMAAGCGGDDAVFPVGSDSGSDAPHLDAPTDRFTQDVGSDTNMPVDAGQDSQSVDTGVDSPVDAGIDSPVDAGIDSPVDAGVDSGVDAGACNALTNIGLVIDEIQVATAAPTPAGGTVATGTYLLTTMTIFTGPGGATGSTGITQQETVAVNSSTQLDDIRARTGMGTLDFSATYTTTATTTFTANLTCPVIFTQAYQYTATTTEIDLFQTFAGGNVEEFVYIHM